MSLGFKGRERGGWWVSLLGWDNMAASGVAYRKALVGTGWTISLKELKNRKRGRLRNEANVMNIESRIPPILSLLKCTIIVSPCII